MRIAPFERRHDRATVWAALALCTVLLGAAEALATLGNGLFATRGAAE